MEDIDLFEIIPAGSLSQVEEEERRGYIGRLLGMNGRVRDILMAERTGIYLRGLAKQYELENASLQKLSLSIFQVAAGMEKIEQWPILLAKKLSLPEEKAHKITQEIEKDLLAPMRAEMEEYWIKAGEGKAGEAAIKKDEQGIGNVVDLRNKKGGEAPRPPAIPR